MSGIFGIINLDGAPVEPERLDNIKDSLTHRGPDAQQVWIDGPFALGHTMLHTTPESLRERQPCTVDGRAWITADARVDNRLELIARLEPTDGHRLRDATDVELILRTYLRWNEECAKYIIGDFAFAIWDTVERKLFCARDPLGIGSLHYVEQARAIVFGTTVESVLAGLHHRPPPNETAVADFLLHRFARGTHETFYQGVCRLPPGHSLVVERGRVRCAPYYTLGATPSSRESDDNAHIERFREIFAQAVACRLRSCTPVSVQVSGGLDSSSVACMANHLLESGGISIDQPVRIQSCVYPNLKEMDELSYQQAVIDACPHLEFTFLDAEPFWAMRYFDTDDGYSLHQPAPHPQRSWWLGNLRHAASGGSRVLLSGNGSDYLMGAYLAYWRPEPLGYLDWRSRFSESPHFLRNNSLRDLLWALLVKPVVKPLVPQRLRAQRGLRRSRRRAPWVSHELLSQISDASTVPAPNGITLAGKAMHRMLTSGWISMFNTCNSVDAGNTRVEWRDPYMDRRLVEFMLQVPARLLFKYGWYKYILRQGMRDILPAEIRLRKSNVVATALIRKGLQNKERDRLATYVGESMLASRGWIDDTAWRQAWARYVNQDDDDHQVLVDGLNVEGWLRRCAA